jgi:hypothetical protein
VPARYAHVAVVSWPSVVAVCVAVAALGAAADQLLKSRLKHRVYDYLLALWSRLESARVADLPATLAALALAKLKLGPSEGKLARVAKVLLGSFMLTAVAAIAGRLARRYAFPWYEARWLPPSVDPVEATVVHTQWLYEKIVYYSPALFVNLVFDAATVVATARALAAIARAESVTLRYLIILLNVGIALLLAIGSLGVAHWLVAPGLPFTRSMAWAAECIVAALTWDTSNKFAPGFDDAFVGLSTLLPISLYLLVLACAIHVKALLLALRSVSLYWLELATEPLPKDIESRFKPFTLLGLVFGTFGVIAKLFLELARR